MWKKAGFILIVLMLGSLLPMGGSAEPVEEYDDSRYLTSISELLFGPKEEEEDPLWITNYSDLFDVYERNKIDDLHFVYQLKYKDENGSRHPLPEKEITLEIRMGSYCNRSIGITDSEGKVYFDIDGKLKDTATRNYFSLQSDQNEENITFTVSFNGDENFFPTSRTRMGIYHRYIPDPPEPTYSILPAGLFMIFIIFTNSFAALIFIPLLAISVRRKKKDH